MPTDEAIRVATNVLKYLDRITADVSERLRTKYRLILLASAVCVLSEEEHACRPRIRASMLVYPKQSPMQVAITNGDDAAYRWSFGVDRTVFGIIVNELERTKLPSGPGRPALCDARLLVGMTLHYLVTAGPPKTLSFAVGLPPSTLSENLTKGLQDVVRCLRSIRDASIAWPSLDKQDECAQLILKCAGREPPVPIKLLGFVDGTVFRVPEPPTSTLRLAYYNKFHGCYCIGLLLLFLPTGEIASATYGYSGNVCDSRATCIDSARLMRDVRITRPDIYLVGDGGFYAGHLNDIICAPLPKLAKLSSEEPERSLSLAMSQWIRTTRSCNEWSIKDIKRTFPRLASILPSRRERWELLIEVCLRVYQLRVRQMPHTSQMKARYDAEHDARLTRTIEVLARLAARAAPRAEAPSVQAASVPTKAAHIAVPDFAIDVDSGYDTVDVSLSDDSDRYSGVDDDDADRVEVPIARTGTQHDSTACSSPGRKRPRHEKAAAARAAPRAAVASRRCRYRGVDAVDTDTTTTCDSPSE